MSSAMVRKGSGSSSTLVGLVVGVPAGVGLLWAILDGPLHHETAQRYLHHPVEQVELVMFCAGMFALIGKWIASRRQSAATRAEILPRWDGKAVPPTQAAVLLKKHEDTLARWGGAWLGRRYLAVLDFIRSRGSANELDDQIRSLADADAMALEASYSFTRFITWAIPILGFLGTVLGITDSIQHVNPDDVSKVTEGLGLAFDATALGLGLTMVLMFFSFLVERAEASVLEQVDAIAEAELAHRFLRAAADQGPLLSMVEASTQRMFEVTETLVQKQADLWSQTHERIAVLGRDSAKEQHGKLVASLEAALKGALTKHSERLLELESQMLARQERMLATIGQLGEVLLATSQKHQQGLADVSKSLAQQTTALAQLQLSGAELTRLQESLTQNLNALAGAGAFEEAVQSLTAAIHLMTTRSAPIKKSA